MGYTMIKTGCRWVVVCSTKIYSGCRGEVVGPSSLDLLVALTKMKYGCRKMVMGPTKLDSGSGGVVMGPIKMMSNCGSYNYKVWL